MEDTHAFQLPQGHFLVLSYISGSLLDSSLSLVCCDTLSLGSRSGKELVSRSVHSQNLPDTLSGISEYTCDWSCSACGTW